MSGIKKRNSFKKRNLVENGETEEIFIKTLPKNKKRWISPYSFVLEQRGDIQEIFEEFFNFFIKIYEGFVCEGGSFSSFELGVFERKMEWIFNHLDDIFSLVLEIHRRFQNRKKNTLFDSTYTHFSQNDLELRRILGQYFNSAFEIGEKKVTFEDEPQNFQKARKTLRLILEQVFNYFSARNEIKDDQTNENYSDQESQIVKELGNIEVNDDTLDEGKHEEIGEFIQIIQQNLRELYNIISTSGEVRMKEKLENFDIFSGDFQNQEDQVQKSQILEKKDGEIFFNSSKTENKLAVLQNSFQIKFNIKLNANNFGYCGPEKHQLYVAQAAKQVKKIVPVKISNFFCNKYRNCLEIQQDNYFEKECVNKILYYFQPGTKTMWIYDLEICSRLLTQNRECANKIELDIDFVFSEFHRSVITPEGKIFLFAGKKMEGGKLDNSFMEFDFENHTFVERKKKMPVAKKNFAVKLLNDTIYIVGGQTENSRSSDTCECFNLTERKWEKLDCLNEGVYNPTLVTLDNQFLFKFGGINKFGIIDKTVERFDPRRGKWKTVQYSASDPNDEIQILSNSLGIQIDQDRILIFSGKNSNDFKHDDGFIFENLGENLNMTVNSLQGEVKSISNCPKTIYSYSGILNPDNVMLHNDSIYFLRTGKYREFLF
ncbi:hypothetical protein PPERSA_03163 [Pseudocohnilembus persalinus]|uniref:Uncharacterized protein n=1 Tax=Pseudocohnilembus persalinus TaxID=266149 RepID=A0A0V0QJ73_PSEPJ|nr:hypothetical protein PPERSA_03163 [Pseudocohnilembus persalinus]|eukprot:KRX02101.1 hypothetical protein PPERSA_03163 [Pseudocohnilembus persalinus]